MLGLAFASASVSGGSLFFSSRKCVCKFHRKGRMTGECPVGSGGERKANATVLAAERASMQASVAASRSSGALPAAYGESPAILISNDDGLDPGVAITLDLARAMVENGNRVVVCAPSMNNSACGQKITLGQELELRRHLDLEEEYGGSRSKMLTVYSLQNGTPADCVIVAIEPRTGILARLGLRPILMLSGVNVGPNLGPDIGYSGTYAAARQAAMYGIPGVASSLAAYGKRAANADYESSCMLAVSGVARLATHLLETLPNVLPDAGRVGTEAEQEGVLASTDPESAIAAVRAAFAAGHCMVNVNFPLLWEGEFEACILDNVLYRDAVKWGTWKAANGKSASGDDAACIVTLPTGTDGNKVTKLTIAGGQMCAMLGPGSDALATSRGLAAISTLSTWPATHPYAVAPAVLEAGLVMAAQSVGSSGLPLWIVSGAREHEQASVVLKKEMLRNL
jgi:5'-nucleotidase